MDRLQVYLPVKPFKLNQAFGANIPCVPDTPDVPVAQRKVVDGADNNTCPPGYVKLYGLLGLPGGHNGNDLAAGEQPCYASLDGTVIEMQTHAQLGLGLGIVSHQQYDLDEHGTHLVKIRYWHLKSFNVQVGQQVKAGDMIGITDNTGFSSGDHCHWEGVPLDEVNSLWQVVFPDNGFQGAIDLMPFCNMQYASDIAINQAVAPIIAKVSDIIVKTNAISATPEEKNAILTVAEEILQHIKQLL